MTIISIYDFVVIFLCGLLLSMIWYSCHNVFNKKKINTLDVLTFLQVPTDKRQVLTDKKKIKMSAYKKE